MASAYDNAKQTLAESELELDNLRKRREGIRSIKVDDLPEPKQVQGKSSEPVKFRKGGMVCREYGKG